MASSNKFANDGSFLEMFKKKMEEQQEKQGTSSHASTSEKSDTPRRSSLSESEVASHSREISESPDKVQPEQKSDGKDSPTSLPKKSGLLSSFFVGKRRGPALKTGAVKKQKKDEEETGPEKKDAWSEYMAEVKKYKSMSCQEENKTRPLVK